MKVVYRACFMHRRIYHPKLLHWIITSDDLPGHADMHLEAAACDVCTGEPHEERTEERENVEKERTHQHCTSFPPHRPRTKASPHHEGESRSTRVLIERALYQRDRWRVSPNRLMARKVCPCLIYRLWNGDDFFLWLFCCGSL